MTLKKTKLFLFLIILIHLTFIFLSLDQLYYGDEVSFIIAAKEIASGQITGRFSHLDGKLHPDESNMLMHPPTYIYLLALSIFLFGESSYSIRAVSMLFSIGVIILLYLITRKILERRNFENSESWALAAAFLYAISPIAIQNSILVDIDGGLLNFFVLLFIYFYISKKNFYYLIPSLFMVFASKMLAPLVLFASLFIINLIVKDYKEIFRVVKLYLIAGSFFFLSFFAYAEIFGLNWKPLFFHNSIFGILKQLFTSPYTVIARSLWGFKTFFYFVTPFLSFLFIITSFILLRNIIKNKADYIRENKDLILLWFYALITFSVILISGLSGWNFTKYHIAGVPPMIMLVIYFTPKKIINIKKILFLIIITALLLAGYFIFFLNDPLIPEIEGRVITVSFSEVAKLVLIRLFKYAVVPIFLCIGLIRKIPKRKIWLTLFFLMLFTSIYLDIMQAKADYSTHNLYGDRGLKEVIKYMEDKPPEQILCYVHVCYFIDYEKTYELTTLYLNPNLLEIINKNNINWIILYQKDIESIEQRVIKSFELEKEIGSYKILRKRS